MQKGFMLKVGHLNRPLKAIRAKCLDCTAGSFKYIEFCPSIDCPLWPYRFGKGRSIAAKQGKNTDPILITDKWREIALEEMS